MRTIYNFTLLSISQYTIILAEIPRLEKCHKSVTASYEMPSHFELTNHHRLTCKQWCSVKLTALQRFFKYCSNKMLRQVETRVVRRWQKSTFVLTPLRLTETILILFKELCLQQVRCFVFIIFQKNHTSKHLQCLPRQTLIIYFSFSLFTTRWESGMKCGPMSGSFL